MSTQKKSRWHVEFGHVESVSDAGVKITDVYHEHDDGTQYKANRAYLSSKKSSDVVIAKYTCHKCKKEVSLNGYARFVAGPILEEIKVDE